MLYSKKLDGIDALLLERRLLKSQLKEQEVKSKKSSKKKSKEDNVEQQAMAFVERWLGDYSSILSIAAQFVMPIVVRKAADFGLRRILLKTAKELGEGYLKWKTIEIIAKWIFKKSKEKKQEA